MVMRAVLAAMSSAEKPAAARAATVATLRVCYNPKAISLELGR